MSFARGDVVLARLNPNHGSEIGKIRPVLILTQTALIEAGLPLIMVAPLTTQFWPELAPLRIQIPPRERLLKISYAVIEQTRSLDRNRLQPEILTRLTAQELQSLEQKLKLLIGFD
jgi:mRNA interferase MazF